MRKTFSFQTLHPQIFFPGKTRRDAAMKRRISRLELFQGGRQYPYLSLFSLPLSGIIRAFCPVDMIITAAHIEPSPQPRFVGNTLDAIQITRDRI